jgi:hypothetical protein
MLPGCLATVVNKRHIAYSMYVTIFFRVLVVEFIAVSIIMSGNSISKRNMMHCGHIKPDCKDGGGGVLAILIVLI